MEPSEAIGRLGRWGASSYLGRRMGTGMGGALSSWGVGEDDDS